MDFNVNNTVKELSSHVDLLLDDDEDIELCDASLIDGLLVELESSGTVSLRFP